MNLISKRLKEIYNKKRVHEWRKIVLNETIDFSKNNKIKIFDSRVDFLTVKIVKTKSIQFSIEDNLSYPYSTEEINLIDDIFKLNNKLILFNKFIILFTWLAFNNQKKIYWIYDSDKNKIWQIVLKNSSKIQTNKNVIDTLEFKWLFCKHYMDCFDDFLNYFWVNKNQSWIVTRLDYCVDFKWIECFELLNYLKFEHKVTQNVNGLSSSDKQKYYDLINSEWYIISKDKKQYLNNHIDFQFWRQPIYKNFRSAHNDLKFYDKILDLLDNHRKRKINWVNPYQDYLDSDNPITRVEVKKKKFQNLKNNSINWLFENMESLFFDHLLRYMTIDLSLYIWVDVSLNWKKNFLAEEKKTKIASSFNDYGSILS